MSSFFVFVQKEFLELIRTKRFFILLCIFALFGMIGPVTARYMQDIILMAMGDNLPLTFPPTTWIDGWGQFYSNLSQMGNICIIFLFMACVSGEKQSGSAALTLTKNLSPMSFILAKFTAAASMLFASLVLAMIICYGYTYFLFGQAGDFVNNLMGMMVYAVFMLTLLAVTVLSSTLSQSTVISAILAFCSFIVLTVSNYIPVIGKIMPGVLSAKTLELSAGIRCQDLIPVITVSLCITVLCLAGSVFALKRQEI